MKFISKLKLNLFILGILILSGCDKDINDYNNTENVYCSGSPTTVVEVMNPSTGRIWMDRNLGAKRAAQSNTDSEAFGDLYQWGRRSDGHQCRNSQTINVQSDTDQPSHSFFILNASLDFDYDWRSPSNDNLWQGIDGINNPCPEGFRIPTAAEWEEEISSWSSLDDSGAFNSQLKLPLAGWRAGYDGIMGGEATAGEYWSSTMYYSQLNQRLPRRLLIIDHYAGIGSGLGYSGLSIRCIKD